MFILTLPAIPVACLGLCILAYIEIRIRYGKWGILAALIASAALFFTLTISVEIFFGGGVLGIAAFFLASR